MSFTIGFLQMPNRDFVCTPSAIELTFSAIAIQYLQVPQGISKNTKLKSTIKKELNLIHLASFFRLPISIGVFVRVYRVCICQV